MELSDIKQDIPEYTGNAFRAYRVYVSVRDFFVVVYNYGNCKLITLDYIGRVLEYHPEETIARINEIGRMGEQKVVFQCYLINKEHVDVLQTHFTALSIVKLPIGYYNTHAYMCTFKFNNISQEYTYEKRLANFKLLTNIDV